MAAFPKPWQGKNFLVLQGSDGIYSDKKPSIYQKITVRRNEIMLPVS